MRRQFLNCIFSVALVFVGVLTSSCETAKTRSNNVAAEVRAALERQERQWNAGDLAGFMETYARSDDTRFASGGDVVLGWNTVFNRYRTKYPDRAAMGTLTFSELEIAALGPDAALAFGRWQLKRAHDEPSGLFTLLFRNTKDGWRIVHDHTSSAVTKP